MEGRKLESSSRTSQEKAFSTSVSEPSFVVQPVIIADGLVNGNNAHNSTFVTHVDLHHAPEVTPQQQHTTPVSVLVEPEPDYDSKDDETAIEDPPPPLTEDTCCGSPIADPPTPPPLPPPSSLGFSSGLQLSLATRVRSTERPEPADVTAAKQRDEAHAALMAAVQRRRHLLDSVDGEVIADNIESRVQRSKMLQTVYRADHGSVERRCPDESTAEHQVGLLSPADQRSQSTTSMNGDFATEAERVRLEYVRRLRTSPTSTKQPPPMKPLRSQPPTAPKTIQNGDGQPAGARRSVLVNEGHNRALAAYVNGSSNKTPPGPTTTGYVDNSTPSSFVRLHDAGESTTEQSPCTVDTSSHERRLRIVTDDTASLLSSLSTLSTNSSVGGVGVGVGDGTVSPHGSPSHSSSGDSGFAKSSTTTGGDGSDQPIIPPPVEFASPSDNSSSSSSSSSVQTTVHGAALRSVARNQSHSIVFPARAQLTQK